MNHKTRESNRVSEIKQYWEDQAGFARDGGDRLVVIDAERNVFAESSGGGTMKDWRIRDLEVGAFENHISSEDRVLDVGCGNGFATVQLASRTGCTITGLDYSTGMIDNARVLLSEHYSKLSASVDYVVGDVLELDDAFRHNYEVVITERCLINLADWASQKQGIKSIADILTPGGLFLMLEGSLQGLENLNQVRRTMGLTDIKSPWHNQFFNEQQLFEYSANYFYLEGVDNFSSMYMLISRALHPKLVEPDSPTYEAKINDIALQMPNMGEFGYLKLYVFKKN